MEHTVNMRKDTRIAGFTSSLVTEQALLKRRHRVSKQVPLENTMLVLALWSQTEKNLGVYFMRI